MQQRGQEEKIEVLKRKNILYRDCIIFLFVLVLCSYAAYFFGHRKGTYDIVHNQYPLIDPARAFIPQDDYVVNLNSLRTYLQGLGQQYGSNITIYYEQLNSGANISVNPTLRFYLASLVKLPTAMIAMKKFEDGTWNWNTEFPVEPSEVDSGSGNLYKNTDTTQYTLKQLLSALLIDSDNTAENILNKNFTLGDFQSIVDEDGLEDLFNAKFQGSAKEYSRLLRSLYSSSYLKRANSETILDLMTQATFKSFLSTGVPDGIKFAHKYGENTDYHIFADAGIVYDSKHPYMLTVIYQGPDGTAATEQKAEALMKDISTNAYQLSAGN